MTTATVITVIGTGSRYESKNENGLAHFLEHMFFKGTSKRPKAEAIARELDCLGASYNAYTGKERTGYYAKVAADKIIDAMDVIHDIVLHSTLSSREIKKESGAILQEINMYADRPARTVHDIFDELLYGQQHALGRTILGPKKNITSFTRKDFQSYLSRCYGAKNTVICVAGNFPQGKILAKIKKDFACLDPGEKITFTPYIATQKKPEIAIKNKKTDQTHLILGVRSGGANHKDRYALAVLANILGGGMSSRLFSEIREKRGLAYSIGASTNLFHETGSLIVYGGVEHDNLIATVKIILREMKKIAKDSVTKEELDRAKTGFEGRIAFGYETSDDIAEHFAEQEMLKEKITLPDETLTKIAKVKRTDIKRVAKEICVNGGLNLAIVGPHKENEKALKTMLHF